MSPRILVIDDEPDMRELVSLALEMTTSWEVATAGSADEALGALRADRFDGIVCDMMMPHMDGMQLLAAVREIPNAAEIPAVLLSGQSTPPAESALRALRVVGTIRKPFDPRTLGTELAASFGWNP